MTHFKMQVITRYQKMQVIKLIKKAGNDTFLKSDNTLLVSIPFLCSFFFLFAILQEKEIVQINICF
jgi:hypothetical protein